MTPHERAIQNATVSPAQVQGWKRWLAKNREDLDRTIIVVSGAHSIERGERLSGLRRMRP